MALKRFIKAITTPIDKRSREVAEQIKLEQERLPSLERIITLNGEETWFIKSCKEARDV